MNLLIEKMKTKTASMKSRGVAFAIESIVRLNHTNEDTYRKLEKVVLAKLDDF